MLTVAKAGFSFDSVLPVDDVTFYIMGPLVHVYCLVATATTKTHIDFNLVLLMIEIQHHTTITIF